MSAWTITAESMPPENETVETQNGDDPNYRSDLKRQGRLWFVPDGSMYVYYTPKWWRKKDSADDAR